MITHEEDLQRLLVPEEAAYKLGVKVNTLNNWRCQGTKKLPYVKIGRCVRYRLDDINRFIAENILNGSTQEGGRVLA